MSSPLAQSQYRESCIICEQMKPKGIHLCTSFICYDCEKELLHTDISNPKYKYFLKQLRKITTPEIFS